MHIQRFGLFRLGNSAVSCDFSMVMFVTAFTLASLFSGPSDAESTSNAQSPIGINLASVSYYSSELPFLNIFKTGSAWLTRSSTQWNTGEQQYLNLDSDGWPKTLTTINEPTPQQFTSLAALFLNALPQTANGYYPAGKYVVLYQGQGTLAYGFDATLLSSSAGRDVINVATPSAQGILIQITATDPSKSGNYLRNIQLVKAENESLITSGQVFNPAFLAMLKNFRALRFMDWFNTNGTQLSSWSKRPLPSNAFWGTANGVPIEVAIQLANAVSADAWLNVPVMADDDYITQMATLVFSQLGVSQKAYVELSNEVWNGTFSQNAYSISKGVALFPQALNQWYSSWEWYGMRVAQMSDIWFGVYGSNAFNARVVTIMSAQDGGTAMFQEELSTPDWTGPGNGPAANHHIGAAAMAPYFFPTPSSTEFASILTAPDGGLSELFAQEYASGGDMEQIESLISSVMPLLATYKLPLLAYEGGQGMEGSPNYGLGSPQLNLIFAANRDPRMGAAYTAYLNGWKANGGTLFMHFEDAAPYSQYGEYGLLESLMQTISPLSSAPPKWQAVQNFIANNPCWWSACAASISSSSTAVPQAPSSLTIH